MLDNGWSVVSSGRERRAEEQVRQSSSTSGGQEKSRFLDEAASRTGRTPRTPAACLRPSAIATTRASASEGEEILPSQIYGGGDSMGSAATTLFCAVAPFSSPFFNLHQHEGQGESEQRVNVCARQPDIRSHVRARAKSIVSLTYNSGKLR